MNRGDSSRGDSVLSELRRRAQVLLDQSESEADVDMTRAQMLRELQLQRIEIELQQEELRRKDQELEDLQVRFEECFAKSPVGQVILGEEGKVEELNLLAAELLGTNRSCMEGTTLFEHLPEEDHDSLREHLQDVATSEGVKRIDFRLDLPVGSTAHLRMISTSIDSGDDQPGRVRAALMDMSEHVQACQARQQLEKQLHQSHRMETLGRLASGIAHDFNNLLTLIIGYSKLAMNFLPDGDPLEKHVTEINKAGHHASELIEQLLAFSRPESAQSTPQIINEIIAEMETMFDRLIGDDITLHLRLQEDLGSVQFERAQFQQILLNLVVNGRDAMGTGGNLYLRTRNVVLDEERAGVLGLTPGCYVIVEVEDEGDGISPEVQPHIFEPFFTTKNKGNHHGFGLSTTYGIVSQYKGIIDVTSIPDEGACFTVYLPRTDETDISAASEATLPTVLVVDDQPELRDFAALVLNGMDLEVLIAHSPEDALQRSRACGDELNLVVTDVTMPGMSGPLLVEKIRQFHPDAQVLFISGHDHDILCADRDLRPEDPFLEKPFNPDRLRAMVESLLFE